MAKNSVGIVQGGGKIVSPLTVRTGRWLATGVVHRVLLQFKPASSWRWCCVQLLLCWLLVGCGHSQTHKISAEYSFDDPQFERTVGSLFGPPMVAGNSIVTLVNGEQIFPEMLGAIRSAKVS